MTRLAAGEAACWRCLRSPDLIPFARSPLPSLGQEPGEQGGPAWALPAQGLLLCDGVGVSGHGGSLYPPCLEG